MASIGAMFAAGTPAAVRVLGRAAATASKLLRSKLTSISQPLNAQVEPILARTGRHPIHPVAFLRQSKRSSRWSSSYSNVPAAVRRFFGSTSTPSSAPFDRSRLPVSRISHAVSQLPGRAPFASTLRPNLTGGAIPRTAGGYAIPGSGRIGGARHFSHTPAAPAQVVQNVSQAMRAFWLSGQRARFDGVSATGNPKYRAVGAREDETARKVAAFPRHIPGSYVDFRVSPTITALSPLAAAFPFATEATPVSQAATLNEEGLLDVLTVDFARALTDFAAVMTDLNRLALLGDLPVLLEKNNVLRVRFPGVDAETLERLCDDIGVSRGIVGQDLDFDASLGDPIGASPAALRYPFCPEAGPVATDKTLTSPGGSLRSHLSSISSVDDDMLIEEFIDDNPWLSSPSDGNNGHESLWSPSPAPRSEDYEGLEGIYRFIEACEVNTGRF